MKRNFKRLLDLFSDHFVDQKTRRVGMAGKAYRGITRLRVFVSVGAVMLATVAIQAVPPGTNDEISARLVPFGSVCRTGDDCGSAGEVLASGPLSGEEVYNQFCFACHNTGVSAAPILGNAADWKARIDKGMDTLMSSTLNGINAMPMKGTCMNCSDEELSEAVTYMLDRSS